MKNAHLKVLGRKSVLRKIVTRSPCLAETFVNLGRTQHNISLKTQTLEST